jgi:hypothetical protein
VSGDVVSHIVEADATFDPAAHAPCRRLRESFLTAKDLTDGGEDRLTVFVAGSGSDLEVVGVVHPRKPSIVARNNHDAAGPPGEYF